MSDHKEVTEWTVRNLESTLENFDTLREQAVQIARPIMATSVECLKEIHPDLPFGVKYSGNEFLHSWPLAGNVYNPSLGRGIEYSAPRHPEIEAIAPRSLYNGSMRIYAAANQYGLTSGVDGSYVVDEDIPSIKDRLTEDLDSWAQKMRLRGLNLLLCLSIGDEFTTTVFADTLRSRDYLSWAAGEDKTTIETPHQLGFGQFNRVSPLLITY